MLNFQGVAMQKMQLELMFPLEATHAVRFVRARRFRWRIGSTPGRVGEIFCKFQCMSQYWLQGGLPTSYNSISKGVTVIIPVTHWL